MSKYSWVQYGNERLINVGINDDGTLHNPNGYPDDVVRAGIKWAEEQTAVIRSERGKRAAETRKRRQEARVYDAAKQLIGGHVYGPRTHCQVCRKRLTDKQSITRGIGPDCWQGVLRAIEQEIRTSDEPYREIHEPREWTLEEEQELMKGWAEDAWKSANRVGVLTDCVQMLEKVNTEAFEEEINKIANQLATLGKKYGADPETIRQEEQQEPIYESWMFDQVETTTS